MYFNPTNTEGLQEIIFYLYDNLVILSKCICILCICILFCILYMYFIYISIYFIYIHICVFYEFIISFMSSLSFHATIASLISPIILESIRTMYYQMGTMSNLFLLIYVRD